MYGSLRGTAPPSLWGSAYYNLGFGGTVVFAGVLGVAFALVSASFRDRKTLNLVQAVGMAGITMTLGLWTTEGPATVLNNGIVVFVLLLVWGDRIARRSAVEQVPMPALEWKPRVSLEPSAAHKADPSFQHTGFSITSEVFMSWRDQ
jgi:Zn-dependent protease with chaperone function